MSTIAARRFTSDWDGLAEQDDEWQDARGYFSPEPVALIDAVPPEDAPALPMAS